MRIRMADSWVDALSHSPAPSSFHTLKDGKMDFNEEPTVRRWSSPVESARRLAELWTRRAELVEKLAEIDNEIERLERGLGVCSAPPPPEERRSMK